MSSDLERTKEELPTGMPKTIVPSSVTWNGQCFVLSGSGVNSSHFDHMLASQKEEEMTSDVRLH